MTDTYVAASNDYTVTGTLQFNKTAMKAFLAAETGPIGLFYRAYGAQVKREAKMLARERLGPVGGGRVVAGTFSGQSRDWHRALNGRRTAEYDNGFRVRTFKRFGLPVMSLSNVSSYASVVEYGRRGGYTISHRQGRRLVLPGGGRPFTVTLRKPVKGKFIVRDSAKLLRGWRYDVGL
jgi:hypothetical protein